MTSLIVVFIRKFRFVVPVYHWSYILISTWRSLSLCSASVFACSEFYLVPIFATTNTDVWFVLRKCTVTSAEQGDASFLMKKKHCFGLSFQPCFGYSILFQEKSLYFAHGHSHPIFLTGLEAVIRNLHFLLQLGLPSGSFALLGIARVLIWLHRSRC